MWVLFGQSSGVVQGFEMSMLQQRGSLFATRPTLFTYAAKREALETMAAELMDVVAKGVVKVDVNQEFPLAKAADAHRALEGRQTTGATVLVPRSPSLAQLFSRYPVLNIQATMAMHAARKTNVIARLTPTLTSAVP